MKKKTILTNYIYNIIYEVLSIIIPILTTPYLSRVLGAKNIGIHSYTNSIVTFFIIFASLGINLYGKREIAYSQDNKKKRSTLFIELLIIRSISSFFSLVIFYYFFCNDLNYGIYFKILIIEIIANMIDISWYYQGLENFKIPILTSSFVKILFTILIFIFVKSENDLLIYFIIYVCANLTVNIFLWIPIINSISTKDLNNINVKKHILPMLLLFIPQIAVKLYSILDRTMIGFLIEDKSEVGYYEQAQKVIRLLIALVTSMGTVMLPRMSSLYSHGDKKTIVLYMKKSTSLVMMLSFPMIFGLLSISSKFVPAFFGDNFQRVVVLLNVTSPIILFIGLSGVIGNQYLLPTNQLKKYTISVLCGLVINVFFNIIFIYNMAALGASISTFLSEFVVLIIQLLLINTELKISEIINASCKYLFASIIMYSLSISIGCLIINPILSIIIQVTASIIVYFSILLLLKDSFLISIYNRYIVTIIKFKPINNTKR